MQVFNRRNFHTLVFATLVNVFSNKKVHSAFGTAPERKLFSRSGDDDFDRAMIAELKRIVQVLEINPGFKYDDSMNAWATMETIVPDTKGTVILGLPLMRKLMEDTDGGVGVAGVCAHECGHIYQFQNGLVQKLNKGGAVIFLELHADFIGGYYMGRRKEFTADRIAKFSAVLYGMGDYLYKDPLTHGSPGQRSAAAEKGYRLALEGNTIAKAAEIGISYVMNL
jgi:hypothetical protein